MNVKRGLWMSQAGNKIIYSAQQCRNKSYISKVAKKALFVLHKEYSSF